jgi:hypothetical protein
VNWAKRFAETRGIYRNNTGVREGSRTIESLAERRFSHVKVSHQKICLVNKSSISRYIREAYSLNQLQLDLLTSVRLTPTSPLESLPYCRSVISNMLTAPLQDNHLCPPDVQLCTLVASTMPTINTVLLQGAFFPKSIISISHCRNLRVGSGLSDRITKYGVSPPADQSCAPLYVYLKKEGNAN